jgi:REP element-mobilizing transposase RayT
MQQTNPSPEGAIQTIPQSLARLHVHLVFSTKNREPVITDSVRGSLHAYMATVLKNLGCHPVLINSVEDHIHLLFELARTIAISHAVEDVKKSSSRWIKEQGGRGGNATRRLPRRRQEPPRSPCG